MTLQRLKNRITRHWLLGLLIAASISCALCAAPGGKERVQWIWSGAITAESAVVKAKLRTEEEGPVRLLLGTDSNLTQPIELEGQPSGNDRILQFTLQGLSPDTRYYYALQLNGEMQRNRRGTLLTFPPPEQPASFKIAFASCARTGSERVVFDYIAQEKPLFFLHMGDFHYLDIERDDLDAFRRGYDRVLRSRRQSWLFRSVPIVYVWDDHDFGKNDGGSDNPGRSAARIAYREAVPHYPLYAGEGDSAIYQAFTVGRVRFLVTDARSERSPRSVPDGPQKTVLGAEQKAWLKREMLAANGRFPLIIWVNSFPWIAKAKERADHWGGFSSEREELARFIRDNGIQGLAMLSGDSHMVAIDDGSNNDFLGSGTPGFPVFHAASLDKRGSVKGGPYSEGTFPGRGQFGLMEVRDDGETIHVSWTGRKEEDVLLTFDFSVSSSVVKVDQP